MIEIVIGVIGLVIAVILRLRWNKDNKAYRDYKSGKDWLDPRD